MTMDNLQTLHRDIIDANRDLSSLIRSATAIPEMPEHSFDDWEKTLRSIEKQVSEEILRVAVVGSVKSGKSTFTNSLFQGDYLKRGAGIITSIVTRVRCGDALEATLYFKSWDEVNGDINRALALLPPVNGASENNPFDIREEKDRAHLENVLDALGPEALHVDGFRNANSVLLSSYLKGYERVEATISSDILVRRFAGDEFSTHLGFVGEDARAVYLNDVQLEINSGNIQRGIEIADCQGCDSPNPLHLAMIQDYLLFTHLIVYVVSSRTGLRQADIRFLSIIKQMGLMDNIVFVINCDFSEHDAMADLDALIARVKEEISLIKPDPDVYCLSSLLNLFRAQADRLTPKDRMRLTQWESEGELVDFSDRETARFQSSFHHKLTGERHLLLVNNHFERLSILSSGLNHWARVNRDILTRDGEGANEIVAKIADHQAKMAEIGRIIKSTLSGAVHRVKEDLKADIERFFNVRKGVVSDALAYVRQYEVSDRHYERSLEDSGFTDTLVLLFQEFKRDIDRYIAEEVNPAVIRFVKDMGERIGHHLQAVAAPSDGVIRDTLIEYDREMGAFGMTRINEEPENTEFQDIEMIRSGIGLKLPLAVATLNYSTKLKTEASLRLGLYSVASFFKRLLRRADGHEHQNEMRALKGSMLRMKRETEMSLTSHFLDHKENIKFQYIFKLADAASDHCYQMLLDRFQIYTSNLSELAERINEKGTDREGACAMLADIAESSMEINQRLGRARTR